jgi:hypothetical protein
MAEILVLEQDQINNIYGKGSLIIMSRETWGGFSYEEKQKLKDAAEDYDIDGDGDSYVDIIDGRNAYFVEDALGIVE